MVRILTNLKKYLKKEECNIQFKIIEEKDFETVLESNILTDKGIAKLLETIINALKKRMGTHFDISNSIVPKMMEYHVKTDVSSNDKVNINPIPNIKKETIGK